MTTRSICAGVAAAVLLTTPAPAALARTGGGQDGSLPAGELVWGGFSGTFSARDGFVLQGDGWPPLAGSLEVRGNELTLTLAEPAPPGCEGPGRYAFAVEDGVLRLSLVEDACQVRTMILDGSVWRPAGAAAPVAERRIVRTFAADDVTLPRAEDARGSWPVFRGPAASGVADGQQLPDEWNGESGDNILWSAPIPGLGHSSPVVWGDRVYVTTAISSDPEASFRPGLYGDGDASADRTMHQWMVIAYDKHSGEVVWERLAYEGEPIDKRHVKSTYASSTPATDGRVVVAYFGSQGLYAFDVDGDPLWAVDVGRVDAGAYDIPSFEWGPATSPVIWNDRVFLQVDTQQDSWLLAFDLASGELVWRTERDELPSWGTPNVVPGLDGPELVTNAARFIRANDPLTGEEIWRLGGSSKITAPTPIFADQYLVVASGRRPERPIFVLRQGARGDVTLAAGETSNEAVVWSLTGRGPYMPTPLVYEGVLYVLGNNGVLDAYDLETGEELYRARVPHLGSGFSASPVAADGKIYLSNEDGDMVVVRAGREFEHVATNPMGKLLMATPALSDGVMYVRSVDTLFAIGSEPRLQQSHWFGDPMLVGLVEESDLRQAPFSDWFTAGYDGYVPDRDLIEGLAPALAQPGVSVEAFFGTWCDDSTREIPRLLRVLTASQAPADRVVLHALSDKPGVFKTSPGGRERDLGVHRTPTIVVLRDGRPLGRIVERPASTLEADLAAILDARQPRLPYGAESELHSLYLTHETTAIQAPDADFLAELETLGDTESLWHYARYDLLFNGRPADAADVLHIFLTLHPDSALGYRWLAQAHADLGDRGAALFAVRRALALDPGNRLASELEQQILAATSH